MSTTLTAEERFLAKAVVARNGCWLWIGAVDPETGYAKFWFEGKAVLAHRLVYELYVGEIPDGMTIDHQCHTQACTGGVLCDHRRCVNPDHLKVATVRVNLLRGKTIVAANAVKTHCLRGHEFTSDNTVDLHTGVANRTGTAWPVSVSATYKGDKHHD